MELQERQRMHNTTTIRRDVASVIVFDTSRQGLDCRLQCEDGSVQVYSSSESSSDSNSEIEAVITRDCIQRNVISMGLFHEGSELDGFKRIIRQETNQFRASFKNIDIEQKAILKTLRRLLFVSVSKLKEVNAPLPGSVAELLFYTTNTSVVESFVHDLKTWSSNNNTLRNELRRIVFLQTYCLLYQTAPEEHAVVESTRRSLEFIQRMLRFVRGQIKTPTKEDLVQSGRWYTISVLREKVNLFFKENIEQQIQNKVLNKAFINNYEIYLFLFILVNNRPARSQVYNDLNDSQISTSRQDSERLCITSYQFKTVKKYRLFQLTLGHESSRLLSLWINKYRQYKSSEDKVFTRQVKDMARVIDVSVRLVRHYYRSELSEADLSESQVHTMDSADCHTSSTAQLFYVNPSIERRKIISDEADDLYNLVFK